MTVKLALLKSGEDVIANIQEMVVEDKLVGYFFENPCVAKIIAKDYGQDGNTKMPCQIQLTAWIPLSNDKKIPVTLDWVITIVEPINQLKQMYENGVLNNGKNDQSNNTSQSTEIDIAN